MLDELELGPEVIGAVAAVGGASSLIAAVVSGRATRRWGFGPVSIAAMLLSAVGTAFIPLAPTGLPLIAIGCLVVQQIVADSAATVYDVTETSVRQARVHDRALGRVSSTFHVGALIAQLAATIAAGVLAELIGLRAIAWLAPVGGLLAATILWRSPVRRLQTIAQEGVDVTIDPLSVLVAPDDLQPPGA